MTTFSPTNSPMLSGATLENAQRLGLGNASIGPTTPVAAPGAPKTFTDFIANPAAAAAVTAPNLTKPLDATKLASVTPKTYPAATPSTLASSKLGVTVSAQGMKSQVPAGWDATTYSNFKAANPNLEPTPEDTAKMLGANNAPQEKNGRQSTLDSLLGIFKQQQGQAQDTLDQNKKAGVDEKQQAATKIKNDLAASTRAWDDKIEKARTQPGISADQAAANVAQLEQQKNHELADLSIQLSAANGDYSTAKDIAQRAIDAKYEPLKNEIQTLQTYYNLSQNDMSESEKMQAQAVIQQKKDAVDFQQQKDLAAINHKYSLDEIYTRDSLSNTGSGTLSGKPQNNAQLQANGYADRTAQSNIILSKLDNKFGAVTAIGGSLPNFAQSGDRQAYEQAKKNFVTAVLRRESGAVISPTEFKTEAQKYFTQPGDKPETIAQKQAARNTAINNLYREANVARPVGAGDIIESGGVQYQVDSDGVTLIPV